MLGRSNGAKRVVADAAATASPYVDQLANDEKLRGRLVAGLTAGLAARERARRQAGLVGAARRLATDPVLRAQLGEMALHLQQAKKQVKRNRSHKLRNAVLFASGVGMILAAKPSLRSTIASKVRGGDEPQYDAWTSEAARPDADAETPLP